MTKLETATNRYPDPDQAYRMLVDAHHGLTEAESAALNARLVLVLANQIGDLDVLRQALDLALASSRAATKPPEPA